MLSHAPRRTSDPAIVGLIDWSAGGYADRRFDLATACWSIRYNLSDEAYVKTFLHAYGYQASPESLRYFEDLYFLLG
jgi:aminoglycoside 3'-phosphotransferase-2